MPDTIGVRLHKLVQKGILLCVVVGSLNVSDSVSEHDLGSEVLGRRVEPGLLCFEQSCVLVAPQVELERQLVLIVATHVLVHDSARIALVLKVNLSWHVCGLTRLASFQHMFELGLARKRLTPGVARSFQFCVPVVSVALQYVVVSVEHRYFAISKVLILELLPLHHRLGEFPGPLILIVFVERRRIRYSSFVFEWAGLRLLSQSV